jgi:hypothetical protein
MASTDVTFSFALKERYTDRKVEDLTLADRPLMAMMAKDEELMGSVTPVPLIYSRPQGLAAISVARAQLSETNVVGAKFNVESGDYHASVYIGDKVMEQSRANPGAFLTDKTAEIDGLYEEVADTMAFTMYGNGGNALGQVTGALVGQTATITPASAVMLFSVGMSIERNVNDGTNVATAPIATTYVVSAVNPEAGTVTFVDATGIADTNYLFRKGDFTGNTGIQIFPGLQQFIWVDSAPPVLYGMTRTADPIKLAGCRIAAADVAGMGIQERLQRMGSYMVGRYKGKGIDSVFLHPEDWQNLSTGLQSQGWRTLTDDTTRFGFTAITGVIGGKTVKIYSDRFCPLGTAFLLRMNTWKLHSMGKLIHPLEKDGLTILRGADNNNYEYRLVSYPAMSTNAPGWNGRVSVAA